MDLTEYNKYKGEMRTGDVLLWHTDSLLGSAIQHFTKSNVNHASMVLAMKEYEGEEKRRFIIEAMPEGTVLNLLSRRLEKQKGQCWWLPLQDDWTDNLRNIIGQRMLGYIGIDYDYPSLLANAVCHVEADPTELFCSEIVYLGLGFQGIAPRPNELPKLGIFKEAIEL